MDKYTITGMSCAACAQRVEKAVSAVPGVDFCAVNLLTNSMSVKGNAHFNDIIKAVEKAGYGAIYQDELILETDTKSIKKRLFISAILTIILMYFTMGVPMLSLPAPSILNSEYLAGALGTGILGAIIALAVMIVNRKFFINGFKGIVHLSFNMDTLVALGSGVSYLYSLVILIVNLINPDNMNIPKFYFESAAMILTLITVGKLLETISKGRTTDAIKSLINMSPRTATVLEGATKSDIENGRYVSQEIVVSQVKIGDYFIVESGMNIPVDGVIVFGKGLIDESALTGESELVSKKEGEEVSTATTNIGERIICKATKVGNDTTLAQIIKTVADASATKAPIARVADKVAGIFVPIVMIIAIITFVVWMIIGQNSQVVLNSSETLLAFALSRAISVLVISCPCALGLATPVAIMVGSGVGSKHGILFKSAQSIEEAGKPNIIVLDKTGTITTGEVGSDKPKDDSKEAINELKELGLCVVMLSGDKKDRALNIAKEVGIEYVISNVLPNQKGDVIKKIQNPIAQNLLMSFPEKVLSQSATNKVIMVGDGINDAPALKIAEIGMAIGAGKDIAIDAAEIVLMNNSIKDVAAAIRLSRRTLLNIKENLFWAFIYNIICIPLAAGVYTELFGWTLNPMIGAAAMALSSFCVVMNALRLNLYNPYKKGKTKVSKTDISDLIETINDELVKGEKTMEKLMHVEGMMCGHCEAHVKEALEKLPEVKEAIANHEKNEVLIKLNADISDDVLKQVITEAGYKAL